jgi:hypothetical protein
LSRSFQRKRSAQARRIRALLGLLCRGKKTKTDEEEFLAVAYNGAGSMEQAMDQA